MGSGDDGVGSGVLEVDEGGGTVPEGKGDDSDDGSIGPDVDEVVGLGLDGGGVGVGDSDEEDEVSEEGECVPAGSAGKVVVSPLTIAETRPLGD